MESLKYDVFISYSRKDYVDEQKNVIPGNAILRIMEALKKAGISYWFDKEGIYSGNEFTDKIVTNIEASSVLLFLSTKNANSSQWTSKEIACADELHKYIIPVRLDHSPYNKKVLFRIADRSYIDFESNPDKGICEIVQSIELYKEQLEAERIIVEEAEKRRKEMELKKAEELRLIKEQEEKRRKQEQDRIVKDIKMSYATLNNEEAKIELDRENLLINAEKVADNEQRIQLIALIKTGGAIHQKYQGVVSELTNELQAFKSIDIESLKTKLNDKDQKISSLESDLNTSKSHEKSQERAIYRLNGQIDDLQSQLIDLQKKPDDNVKNNKHGASIWAHIVYITLLIVAIVWLTAVYRESKSWKSRYYEEFLSPYLEEEVETVDSLVLLPREESNV